MSNLGWVKPTVGCRVKHYSLGWHYSSITALVVVVAKKLWPLNVIIFEQSEFFHRLNTNLTIQQQQQQAFTTTL